MIMIRKKTTFQVAIDTHIQKRNHSGNDKKM